MIKNLKEILIRLSVVIVFLLFTVWQVILYIIKLIGAILYNIGDYAPFEIMSWVETKIALKDLKHIPSDTYEVLINILKGIKE